MRKVRLVLDAETQLKLRAAVNGRGESATVNRDDLAKLLIDISRTGGFDDSANDVDVFALYALIAGNRGEDRRIPRKLLRKALDCRSKNIINLEDHIQ